MSTLAEILDEADRLRQQGNPVAAIETYRRALALDPRHTDAHFGLGVVLQSQGRAAEAATSYQQAIACDPNCAAAFGNLGNVLKSLGRFDESLASLARAVELRPDVAELHFNLANTYWLLDQLEPAEAEYRRAVMLAPRHADMHNNLANVLQVQGKLDEALSHFDAAVDTRPDFAEAHQNRALLRLLRGDFAQGWPEYEWRFQTAGSERPTFDIPRWDGRPLPGGAILLWCEEGLGDAIQMVRFAPRLKAHSSAKVIVQCRGALHSILSTATGIDRLVTSNDGSAGCDCYVPSFSLPAVLGTRLETIPADVPYLEAEPARVVHWRVQLGDTGDFKVGIAWQGTPTYFGDRYRSIPLKHFAPLAKIAKVKLFSLQKGAGSEQLTAQGPPGATIVDLGPMLDETGGAFLDTAAAMKNLDLVITSDTAIAHLAGVLGVPVWVALQVAPNWRWLLDRPDSPWYPTMRLFRQTRLDDWQGVFEKIAMELQRISSPPRANS